MVSLYKKITLFICALILTGGIFSVQGVVMPQKAHAGLFCICPPFGPSCVPYVADCSRNACECQSNLETGPDTQDVNTIDHITDEFIRHREWLVNVVFEAHVLPAMMLMTEQLTTAAMDQMLILGGFLDAKHQLETQRLVQTMEARAHAQYHPSEGMCQFGTMTRSLAATQRDKEITAFAMASRFIQRQNMNGDGISAGGASDDFRSRFEQMTNVFCNPEDLSGGLDDICNSTDAARMNNDVNFTNIALKNNLALNLATSPAPSEDEEDVMAMQANLYGHRIMPRIPEDRMSNNDGTIIKSAAETYLKMRALTAKRSVAQASFANFIADRTHGGDLVQPYMIAALEQMGIGEEQAIDLFGERPSYHTQMMFLTNTMLQDPTFYSDLYDKPENVDRKKVSIQAINLKLRHDMYDSVLRSNANQAVLLEALLQEPADRVSNEILFGERNSEIMNLPGLN